MTGASAPAAAQAEVAHATKNIVLVHGGFVDGSGWQGVYDALTKKGYAVTIVQNPTASLADDVAFTKRAISAQDGSVILVGHVIDYRVDGDRRSLEVPLTALAQLHLKPGHTPQ